MEANIKRPKPSRPPILWNLNAVDSVLEMAGKMFERGYPVPHTTDGGILHHALLKYSYSDAQFYLDGMSDNARTGQMIVSQPVDPDTQTLVDPIMITARRIRDFRVSPQFGTDRSNV